MGSTRLQLFPVVYEWDHPHIHGEHKQAEIAKAEAEGSPPYTWGALDLWDERNKTVRITPIYMGSTPTIKHLLLS